MYAYVIYKTATGEIIDWMQGTSDQDVSVHGAGTAAVAIANPRGYLRTHYVVGGEVAPRPAMAPTIVGTTISGLPIPCVVKTDGAEFAVTDGVAELDYAYPGTYSVEIEAFPYLKFTTTVTKA